MLAQPNWEEVNKDKEAKKKAVAEYVASKCVADSDIEDFRNVGACLSNGGKLDVTILTGGLCNYSYKISCRDVITGTEHKLFAKLSFSYPVVMPEMTLSLDRAETEFKMMATFQRLSPGLVPSPYFCDDLDDDMKLLVCQYSPVDEQLGNQFIDGAVDPRTPPKIAEAISKLHLIDDFDPDFGPELVDAETSKSWVNSVIEELFKPEKQDRVGTLAKDLGKIAIADMFEVYLKNGDAKECLIHADLHPFNILVGAKPSVENLENFDSSGDVVIIDWEASKVGCAGHDVGNLRPFPTACALSHVINGHRHAAMECLSWVDSFWSTYEANMHGAGKSDDQVTKIFRYSIQVSAGYYLGMYCMAGHADFLPIDKDNAEDLDKVKESVGVLSLKCLKLGADERLSLQELKNEYKGAVEEEMDRLIGAEKIRRSRRPSVLRASGRTVSDAHRHLSSSLERNISLVSVDRLLSENI